MFGENMKLIVSIVIFLLSTTSSIVAQNTSTNVFTTYQDCFRFMLGDENSQTNDDYLFKVAADSSIKQYWFNQKENGIILVIKLDYIKGPYSQFRGAQGNGSYFLFLPQDNGFKFVGRMEGSTYKYHGNVPPTFSTSWHMSSRQSVETIYSWKATSYVMTSKILYQYDLAGSPRKKIKDYLKEK